MTPLGLGAQIRLADLQQDPVPALLGQFPDQLANHRVAGTLTPSPIYADNGTYTATVTVTLPLRMI